MRYESGSGRPINSEFGSYLGIVVAIEKIFYHIKGVGSVTVVNPFDEKENSLKKIFLYL
jgi:hypothetical protein